MKNIPLVLLLIVCVTKSFGQATNRYGHIIATIIKEKKKITATAEFASGVPAVDSSWLRWFETNLNRLVQDVKKIKKGKYIVSAFFVVSKDGSLSDIRCENDPGYGLCNEVLRILKKSRNWPPAQVAPAAH